MTQKRHRIDWKQENIEKTFLEACLHEITINGRKGSSLKPISWKNVGERLKTEHDFIADQKQMKNHYDYLKEKFAAWTKLRNKTGNVFDPVTNKFNLDEEEWQMEIKSNKYVETLRTAPLLYPDLCIRLFDDVTPYGFYGWGPSSKLPHPSEGMDFTQMEQPSTRNDSQAASDESTARSKKRATKRKGKDTFTSKMIEIGEEICKLARVLLEKNTIDDNMGACFEKLEKFPWGKEDPRYMTAILLFGERIDLRKVWLCLDPDCCENWVRNAGRKYGLL